MVWIALALFLYALAYLVFFWVEHLALQLLGSALIFIYLRLARIETRLVAWLLKSFLIQVPLLTLLFYFVDFDWGQAILHTLTYINTLFYLIMISLIFMVKIRTRDLIVTLQAFKIPTKLAITISIVLTFFPWILKQGREIYYFQRARGYSFHPFRLKPLIIPLLLQILTLSTDLTLTLYQRGLESKDV